MQIYLPGKWRATEKRKKKRLKNGILKECQWFVILSKVCITTAFPKPRGIYKHSG
jgi:hypothetical protein